MSQTLLRSKAGKGHVATVPEHPWSGLQKGCLDGAFSSCFFHLPEPSMSLQDARASIHGVTPDVIQTWYLPLGAASLVGGKQGSERTH